MSEFDRDAWLAAEVRCDAARLFPLWCVHTGFCHTQDAFAEQYGSEMLALVERLERESFLEVAGGGLRLTALGRRVMSAFDSEETSGGPLAGAERHDPGLSEHPATGSRRTLRHSAGRADPGETIAVGVVGYGYWGPNLVRSLRSLVDCRLKVVCDLDASRLKHAKQLYPEVAVTTDYEEMAQREDLQAIVIATPVGSHARLAKTSLQCGKHTLVERPLAHSSAEGEELIHLAEARGLVLMVGHTFLYAPAVRRIKDIVDAGDLGDIRYICARRLNLGLFQKDINVTWDLAGHDLSIILHLFGESPLSLNCCGAAHVTPGIEDVSSLFLNFRRERSATVLSSWLDPRKVREITIVGSRRMILFDDVTPLEKIRVFDSRVERPPHYDSFAEFHYAYHYGDVYSPYFRQEEPLKVECQHFLDCIRTGGVPLTSARDGLEIVRILEAASMSLRHNGAPQSVGPWVGGGPTVPRPAARSTRPARAGVTTLGRSVARP